MSRLHELLDGCARHDAEYRQGLSNHLPMALVALHALGASDERLSAFEARYAVRLRPAPAHQPWPSGDAWTARLGDPDAYPAYRDLFMQWLMHERPEQLLPQVLPTLMLGCGAAAFHGLLRTAYGVMGQHLGEVADGLAYWSSRHLPLGALPATEGTESDPETLLRKLPAIASKAPLIWQAMRDAARNRTLQSVVPQLAINERTLAQLSWLAAHAYAGSGNFAVLHLVTSAHAVRVLLPYVEEPEKARHAMACYWQAFATTVAAACIQRRPEVPLLSWKRIVAAALASDDDHVIKLVHSCREHSRVHRGVGWQYAASRVLNPS